jgi:hypothetical protein
MARHCAGECASVCHTPQKHGVAADARSGDAQLVPGWLNGQETAPTRSLLSNHA